MVSWYLDLLSNSGRLAFKIFYIRTNITFLSYLLLVLISANGQTIWVQYVTKPKSNYLCAVFWNFLGYFLEESSLLPTSCHKFCWGMIGSTVRYFILRHVSLLSTYCVLNSVSDLLGETLRKWWLHVQNMIASTILIFMLFEAIFIFMFVCSWWKRWKDLRTSWIPLRE